MADDRHPVTFSLPQPDGIKSNIKSKVRKRRGLLNAMVEAGQSASPRRNDLLPHLCIKYVPIDSIRPAKNPVRKTSPAQVVRVGASLKRFGFVVPLLVDEELRLVHGHTLLEAAKQAGLTEVPVITLSHLSEAERRLLSITLNRLGETGEWDVEKLRIEFEELIRMNEDILVSGFETGEIDPLLQEASDPPEIVEEVDPATAVPVSRAEDMWLLGPHRLLQGDARSPESYSAVMRPGESARLVLSDTPYNVPNAGHVTSQAHHREFAMAAGEMSREEFSTFLRSWLMASSAYVMDGGLVATFIDWRSVELVLSNGRELGLQLLNIVVWAKDNGGQGSLWRSQHELLPVFKKGKVSPANNVELGRFGRWRSNVWPYPGASTLGSEARQGLAVHPTVKPRALLEDALLDVSNRGEIVLDPFAGSGSTLLAAESVGRICRAIEIDGLYCDLTIRRWEELTSQDATLEETGESYRQVAARRLGKGGAA